eukprot:6193021-Pleurochrysis_carterae.AAC.1
MPSPSPAQQFLAPTRHPQWARDDETPEGESWLLGEGRTGRRGGDTPREVLVGNQTSHLLPDC